MTLLAELWLDAVGVQFIDGKLDVGGRHCPSSEQDRRVMRLRHVIVRLAPFAVPIEWPKPRDVGTRLAKDLAIEIGLRPASPFDCGPMAWVSYWRSYPRGFVSGVWS
jgi:hypothetical protein